MRKLNCLKTLIVAAIAMGLGVPSLAQGSSFEVTERPFLSGASLSMNDYSDTQIRRIMRDIFQIRTS